MTYRLHSGPRQTPADLHEAFQCFCREGSRMLACQNENLRKRQHSYLTKIKKRLLPAPAEHPSSADRPVRTAA